MSDRQFSYELPHLREGVTLFRHQHLGVLRAIEMESSREDLSELAPGALFRQYMGWLSWPAGSGKSIAVIAHAGAVVTRDGRSFVSQMPSKRQRVTNGAGMEIMLDTESASAASGSLLASPTLVVVSPTLVGQWEQYVRDFTVWTEVQKFLPKEIAKVAEKLPNGQFFVSIKTPAKAKVFAHALAGDFSDWLKALNSRSKVPVTVADFEEVRSFVRDRVRFVLVTDAMYTTFFAAIRSSKTAVRFTRVVFDEFDSLTPLNSKPLELIPAEFNWYVSANINTVQSGFVASSAGGDALAGRMSATMDIFRDTGRMEEYLRRVTVPIDRDWASDMKLPETVQEIRYGYVPTDLAAHAAATKQAFLPALKAAKVDAGTIDFADPAFLRAIRKATLKTLAAAGCHEEFMRIINAECRGSGAYVFFDESERPYVPLGFIRPVFLAKERKNTPRKVSDFESDARRTDLLDDTCQVESTERLTDCKVVTCCPGCLKHFSMVGIYFTAVSETRNSGGVSESTDLRCTCPNCRVESMVLNRMPVLLRGPNRYAGMTSVSDAVARALKSIFGDRFELDPASKESNNTLAVESDRMVIVFYDDVDEAEMRELACRVFHVAEGAKNAIMFLIDEVRNRNAEQLSGLPRFMKAIKDARSPAVLFMTTRAFSVGLNVQFATDVVLASRQTDPVMGEYISTVMNAAVSTRVKRLSEDLRHQLIGRAQRFGRTEPLRIHRITSSACDMVSHAEPRSPRTLKAWASDDLLVADA